MSADLTHLTILCTAFGKRGGLDRLVRSVRTQHPQARILAAGPFAERGAAEGVDVVKTSADDTPGAARNALLARVRTRYFAVVCDEMQLHRGAALAELLAPVANDRLDIAAGELVRCWKKLLLLTSRELVRGHGTFAQEDGGLALAAGARAVEDGIRRCDYAHHYFVARTDKVRSMGGWDPRLMAGGDLEFFVRAQRFDLRTGVRPEVAAWHWGLPTPASESVSVEAVDRMSLRRLHLPSGAVITPPPVRLAA